MSKKKYEIRITPDVDEELIKLKKLFNENASNVFRICLLSYLDNKEIIQDLKTDKQNLNNTVQDLQADKEKQNNTIQNLQNENESNKNTIQNLQNENESNKNIIQNLQNENENNKNTIQELQADKEKQNKTLISCQNKYQDLINRTTFNKYDAIACVFYKFINYVSNILLVNAIFFIIINMLFNIYSFRNVKFRFSIRTFLIYCGIYTDDFSFILTYSFIFILIFALKIFIKKLPLPNYVK